MLHGEKNTPGAPAPSAGKTVTRGVSRGMDTGAPQRKPAGGAEHQGTQTGDPPAPAFYKQNNARPGPKNV